MFEETGFAIAHMEPLTQPAGIDRHVVARPPGRIVAQNVTIRVRNYDELQDLYALQYVIDARAVPRPATAVT
jgi:hypothetical protein